MSKTFHSFQEYMTDRGKVVSKPPVESTPDYKGPKPKSPAKAATKGKGWEVPNVGKKGTPGAYKSGTDKPQKKAEKGGFADMGDKSLVYEPGDTAVGGKNAVSKSEQGVPGGSKSKGWPKTGSKTESFLADTKGMTTSQFAKHVKKGLNEHCGCEDKKAPHVVAYSVGAFHPDPIQAIRYVTYLANENANLRAALVREARRAGCSASLLEELFSLPESYTALARIIDSEKGEAFNRRLDKAVRENREELRKKAKLHEEVDEPAHDDDMNLDDLDTDKTEEDDEDSDLDMGMDDDDADKGEDDLDLGDDEGGDDLDLGGDDNAADPKLGGKGGAVSDLDLGDDKGGDLGGEGPPDDPHDGNTHPGEDEGEDAPPPEDDDGGKINFDGDDDDLGLDDDGDDDDLGLDDDEDDDLGLDDDEDDDDDLDDDDDMPKKKMPWEDDE